MLTFFDALHANQFYNTAMKLSDIRQDYTQATLNKADLASHPIEQFKQWLEAYASIEPLEPTAMTIATVDAEQRPWQRVLLLKAVDENGLVFFTNYESNKGQQLSANPYASAHFFWPEVERQVSFVGKVVRTSREKSEMYFHSRPKGSQIGAWASEQSRPLASRSVLDEKAKQLEQTYANDEQLPVPEHWGGFRLAPTRVEFWQGRSNRLHDRFEFVLENGEWGVSRLQP